MTQKRSLFPLQSILLGHNRCHLLWWLYQILEYPLTLKKLYRANTVSLIQVQLPIDMLNNLEFVLHCTRLLRFMHPQYNYSKNQQVPNHLPNANATWLPMDLPLAAPHLHLSYLSTQLNIYYRICMDNKQSQHLHKFKNVQKYKYNSLCLQHWRKGWPAVLLADLMFSVIVWYHSLCTR